MEELNERARRLTSSHPNAANADPLVGSRLGGRYELLGVLAVLDGSTLYDAVRHDIDQAVAVCVCHADASREKFVARWQATGALQHPNVASVYGVGARGGDEPAFCVLEAVQGRSLRWFVEQDAEEPKRIFSIIRQLCSALGAAHAAGACHGNLSPDVAFAKETPHGGDHVVLMGFEGVATPGITGTTDSTATSAAAADVLALGCLAFELLSGFPPTITFGDDSNGQEAASPLDWPLHAVRRIPAAFRDIVETLVAPVALRPPSALEALRLLDTVDRRTLALADPLLGRPTRKTRHRLTTPQRKHFATGKRPVQVPASLSAPSPQPPHAAPKTPQTASPAIARAMLSVAEDFCAVAHVTAANIRVVGLRVFGVGLPVAVGAPVRLTMADPNSSTGRTICTGVVQETHRDNPGRCMNVVVALDRRSRGTRYQALLSRWYGS